MTSLQHLKRKAIGLRNSVRQANELHWRASGNRLEIWQKAMRNQGLDETWKRHKVQTGETILRITQKESKP